MKILGFAHATFANVTVPLSNNFELEYSFDQIPDSHAKRDWLKQDLGLHSIQIYKTPFPFEVTTYSNFTATNVEISAVLERYFNNEDAICSSTFGLEFFQFLLHFSSRAFLKSSDELQINQIVFGKSIKFKIDNNASPMAQFLDESSLCCLAFFVDELSITSLENCPVSHHFEKVSEEFEIDLRANKYAITLLKLKGVNIELIARR